MNCLLHVSLEASLKELKNVPEKGSKSRAFKDRSNAPEGCDASTARDVEYPFDTIKARMGATHFLMTPPLHPCTIC